MKKKLLSLALVAGAAGAALAAIKLLSDHKEENADIDFEIPERNDISDAFDEAWYEREHSIITEEEYRETLTTIYDMAVERGETAVNELLEEAYGKANSAVYCHTQLMRDVKESYSYSLEDYIKRCPDEADERHRDELGLNQYAYRDQARTSAKELAEDYYRNLRRIEARLIEYVELLGGDTSKIKKAFDKTRENNQN